MLPQTLQINMIPDNLSRTVRTSQYDVGRIFVFELIDGTAPYEIPEGSTVSFVVGRPDGVVTKIEGDYADSNLSFATTAASTAVAGRCTCEVRIIAADGTDIGSANFTMNVESSPENGATKYNEAVVTKDELKQYYDAIKKIYDATVDGGSGLPSGGISGQVLTKTEDGYAWEDAIASWEDLKNKPFEILGNKADVMMEVSAGGAGSSIDTSNKIIDFTSNKPLVYFGDYDSRLTVDEEYTVEIDGTEYTCTCYNESSQGNYPAIGGPYTNFTGGSVKYEDLAFPFYFCFKTHTYFLAVPLSTASNSSDIYYHDISIKHDDEIIIHVPDWACSERYNHNYFYVSYPYDPYSKITFNTILENAKPSVGDVLKVTYNGKEYTGTFAYDEDSLLHAGIDHNTLITAPGFSNSNPDLEWDMCIYTKGVDSYNTRYAYIHDPDLDTSISVSDVPVKVEIISEDVKKIPNKFLEFLNGADVGCIPTITSDGVSWVTPVALDMDGATNDGQLLGRDTYSGIHWRNVSTLRLVPNPNNIGAGKVLTCDEGNYSWASIPVGAGLPTNATANQLLVYTNNGYAWSDTLDINGLVVNNIRQIISSDGAVIIKEKTDPDSADLSISYNLNDGQWVDTGTQIDGHTVYKSDAGSYNVNSGISRAVVTFSGIVKLTVYIRSYAESSYDYTEIGPLDTSNITRAASTNVLTTKSKSSSTTYYSYTFNTDDGEHFFEIIYSKDSSGNSNDDRGYFYVVAEKAMNTTFEGRIPSNDGVIINSSTEGSSKKFKITVDDTGTISATEVTS